MSEVFVSDQHGVRPLGGPVNDFYGTPEGKAQAARETLRVVQGELDVANKHIAQLEQELASIPFDAEDVALIKAHVRHPGAIEAAALKERLRCVKALLVSAPIVNHEIHHVAALSVINSIAALLHDV